MRSQERAMIMPTHLVKCVPVKFMALTKPDPSTLSCCCPACTGMICPEPFKTTTQTF